MKKEEALVKIKDYISEHKNNLGVDPNLIELKQDDGLPRIEFKTKEELLPDTLLTEIKENISKNRENTIVFSITSKKIEIDNNIAKIKIELDPKRDTRLIDHFDIKNKEGQKTYTGGIRVDDFYKYSPPLEPIKFNFEPTNNTITDSIDDIKQQIESTYNHNLESLKKMWEAFGKKNPEVQKEILTPKDKPKKTSLGQSKKQNPNMPKIPLNTILYGPPGTGKTYITIEKAMVIVRNKKSSEVKKKELSEEEKKKEATRLEITEAFNKLKFEIPTEKNEVDSDTNKKTEGQIAFITFHQSFSYEDFVEGIKPTTKNDGSISYEIQPGIFKLMCEAASKDAGKNYVLIIDEINRGNISQIFGELITLIEDSKRKKHDQKDDEPNESLEIILPYSKQPFSVPDNLYIIGTMNTADRSVEAIDTALRRRFSFEEMPPKPELLNDNLEEINLQNVLTNINARLEYLKDRDHAIGHAFLINCKTPEDVAEAFNQKIVPLLQEYFYNDYSQIQLVLGGGFVNEIPLKPFNGNPSYTEKTKFTLNKVDSNGIKGALENLLK